MSNFQEPSLATAKPNQLIAAKNARTFDDTRMSWPQQLQIIGKDSDLHPRVALSILYSIECWCIASRLRFRPGIGPRRWRIFFRRMPAELGFVYSLTAPVIAET